MFSEQSRIRYIGVNMGIRFSCPAGHKLHVKEHLAGKRGICPACGAKVVIPTLEESLKPASAASGAGLPARADGEPAASPSIVIAVELPATAVASASPPLPDLPVSESPRDQPPALTPPLMPPVEDHGPLSAGVSTRPELPAAVYLAQRRRSRRNQTTIAIALLLAVIVLALVLIWVLQREPDAAGRPAASHIALAPAKGYVALTNRPIAV